jgi:hypothetical protein
MPGWDLKVWTDSPRAGLRRTKVQAHNQDSVATSCRWRPWSGREPLVSLHFLSIRSRTGESGKVGGGFLGPREGVWWVDHGSLGLWGARAHRTWCKRPGTRELSRRATCVRASSPATTCETGARRCKGVRGATLSSLHLCCASRPCLIRHPQEKRPTHSAVSLMPSCHPVPIPRGVYASLHFS